MSSLYFGYSQFEVFEKMRLKEFKKLPKKNLLKLCFVSLQD